MDALDSKKIPPYQELYDRIIKTAKSRFHAQVRLEHHNKAALWTITLSSFILLVAPLAQGFGIELHKDQQLINLIQVLLTVLILVVSVALSMANFSVRSERIHSCGMELNSLARKVYPKQSVQEVGSDYESYSNEYDSILRRYENHSRIDFLRTKNDMNYYYKNSAWFSWLVKLRYLYEFSLYIVILMVEILWTITLFI